MVEPVAGHQERSGVQISSTFNAADGAGYELQMGRWSRRLAVPFLAFAGVEDGDRVLDVGCGTGSLSAAVAEETGAERVDGVDFSEIYVGHAARQYTDPRLHFRVGDACALGLESSSYDRAFSLLMLHFVPDPALAISEMGRVTRPGGLVAAATWDSSGGVVINRMFFDTATALDPTADEARTRNFTRPLTGKGQLAQAWREAGLTDVRDTTLTIRMDFTDFSDYWTPYAGQDGPYAAYVTSLDDAKRTALVDALRRAYCGGEKDGPRSYSATAWAVRGVVAT